MDPRRAPFLDHARSVIRVARLSAFDTSTPEGRSAERYRRIVLSTFASIASTGTSAVVGLILVPLLVGYLGKEQYGLWAAVSSIVPWVSLLDLGLVAGLVVAIAEAHGRGERERASAYFSTSFFSLAAISALLVVAVSVALAAGPWDAFFPVPPGMSRPAVTRVVAVAVLVPVASLPLSLVPQVLAGYQKSYVTAFFSATAGVLSLLLVAVAIELRASMLAIVSVSAVAGVAGSLASFAFLVRRSHWLRPAPSLVTGAALRRLLATAIPLYLFQLGSLLVNQSQRPLLAHRVGLGAVADYDMLMRLYVMGVSLITVSSASFAPSFRESFERGEVGWMRLTFWRLVRIRMAAAVAFSATLVVGGNLLLRAWLGRSDFQYGLGTWLLLSALLLVSIWASSFLELMTILDRIWPQVAVALAQGALTVGLTWALGPAWGVQGAMLAITLPALLLTGWLIPTLAWGLVRRRPPHPDDVVAATSKENPT